MFYCTDIGGGVYLELYGSVWRDMSGGWIGLAKRGIPVIVPSSGSIGDNGALTGITAMPLAAGDTAYLYFPANAIAAGSAAGLYYTVMSSTTAGTIYNNAYTSGDPLPPATPTAFATTGPGAYTQTTGAAITVRSHTIPGGLLGKNGEIFAKGLQAVPNNANNKTTRQVLGATQLSSSAIPSITSRVWLNTIKNANSEAVQFAQNSASDGTNSTGAVIRGAENTASDVTLSMTTNLTVATDYSGFLNFSLYVSPEG
ncbi:MAG: hypothetical protein ACXWXZ_04000 [Candidatus Binatia bacterium]